VGCIPKKINVSAATGGGTSISAKGLRVLLVEDEVMIRLMVADMLEELGYTVVAEAGHIDQALELAQSVEFDLAILDVNLKGKLSTPVAELIRSHERPIIFATGLPLRWGRLPDPFDRRQEPRKSAGRHASLQCCDGWHALSHSRLRPVRQ
jgi:hypothetical protein